MSTCYKTSDNKYKECAPRMSDGRHFTDYRPNCDVDILIQRDNTLNNSFEYRRFLQTKANTLMELNRDHACKKNCCGPCEDDKEVEEGFINYGTMLPEKDMQICNSNNCKVVANDPNGLGLGRQYSKEPNGLLDPFKQCPQALDDNKCKLTEDNFNYYQLKSGETVSEESEEDENNLPRPAMMGGGDMLSGGDPSVYN